MKTGIFFDGYHCQKFWKELDTDTFVGNENKYNKFNFTAAIDSILEEVKSKSKIELNLIYKAWFQGISASHIGKLSVNTETAEVLRGLVWRYHNERTLYIQLIRHGVESIFLEHAFDDEGNYQEKGIDGALTVNCLNNVEQLGLECVIICTNDSDHEPLLHNLNKKGIYTVVVSFNPPKIVSERLKRQCKLQFEFKG